MKCCGSPTTSTVPNLQPGDGSGAAVPSRAREVAAAFNALLLAEAFKPLTKTMGFYGDTVVGIVARTMARDERGGLTDRLESALAAAARPAGPSAGVAP
ncbi:MAG: hypothetical protein NVSMB19_05580 [Vulcanimicrobiaceae bacterium]